MWILYFPISIVLFCTLTLAELPENSFVYDVGNYEHVDFSIGKKGNYSLALHLPDQQRTESTYPLQTAKGDGYNGVLGSYSFINGGNLFIVSFKADANGYQPKVQFFKPFTPIIPPKAGVPTSTESINKHALESIGGSRNGK